MSNDYKGLPLKDLPLKVWVQGVGSILFISLYILLISTPVALFTILWRALRASHGPRKRAVRRRRS